MDNLKNLVKYITEEDSLNIRVFFTQKGKSGYTTYCPNVTPALRDRILELIVSGVRKYLETSLVEYNPLVAQDDVIEYIDVSQIGGYRDVTKSLLDADAVNIGCDIDKLTFYGLEIKDEDNCTKAYFFRRITKFRKLSTSGLFAYFQGNALHKLDEQMLGMDGLVDIAVINSKAYVFSHTALERIFKMSDQYNDLACQALEILKQHNKISNFEQFENDCLDDKRVQKILTKMLNEENLLEGAFGNFDAIEKTIDIFDLDVNISENENGEKVIQYSGNKGSLMEILRIIHDSYYTSTIRNRQGIDDYRLGK